MEWAEKIRIIEKELGIEGDRGRLAHLLGIRPGVISDIKKGKAKNPGANIALLLINKLGVNPNWLEEEKLPVFEETDGLKKQLFAEYDYSAKRLNKQPSPSNKETSQQIGLLAEKDNHEEANKLASSPFKAENRLLGEKNNHEKDGNPASSPDTPGGSMIETKHRGIPLVFEGGKEFEDGIVIPVLGDNPVSAGHGEGIGDGELPTRYIHAPKELAKYPHLMSLPVKGDSMAPTLNDGDMVVCDGGGWDGDGVYVIKTIEEMFVKRVQHTPQGYRIVSDNKLYESYTGSAEEIAIVGRVRAMVVMVPGRRGGA